MLGQASWDSLPGGALRKKKSKQHQAEYSHLEIFPGGKPPQTPPSMRREEAVLHLEMKNGGIEPHKVTVVIHNDKWFPQNSDSYT